MGWLVVYTLPGQGRRASHLHSDGIILLEKQAPTTNAQWLRAVEHVKARAKHKRIKALPLGHLQNLTMSSRTLHYNMYERDVVMAVFEATAGLQTHASALPWRWISICLSSRARNRSFQCWWSWSARGTPTFGNYKRAPGARNHNRPRWTISPNGVPGRRG
jgi:hypothetical protein